MQERKREREKGKEREHGLNEKEKKKEEKSILRARCSAALSRDNATVIKVSALRHTFNLFHFHASFYLDPDGLPIKKNFMNFFEKKLGEMLRHSSFSRSQLHGNCCVPITRRLRTSFLKWWPNNSFKSDDKPTASQLINNRFRFPPGSPIAFAG